MADSSPKPLATLLTGAFDEAQVPANAVDRKLIANQGHPEQARKPSFGCDIRSDQSEGAGRNPIPDGLAVDPIVVEEPKWHRWSQSSPSPPEDTLKNLT